MWLSAYSLSSFLAASHNFELRSSQCWTWCFCHLRAEARAAISVCFFCSEKSAAVLVKQDVEPERHLVPVMFCRPVVCLLERRNEQLLVYGQLAGERVVRAEH